MKTLARKQTSVFVDCDALFPRLLNCNDTFAKFQYITVATSIKA